MVLLAAGQSLFQPANAGFVLAFAAFYVRVDALAAGRLITSISRATRICCLSRESDDIDDTEKFSLQLRPRYSPSSGNVVVQKVRPHLARK